MSEPTVVVTDWEFSDLSVEQGVLDAAGIALRGAQSRDPAEIAASAQDATALLVQYATVDGDLMDRLPSLELIVRYGVGLDTIDLAAAEQRDIAVCNVLDYGTEEVAAHSAALLFAVHRHVHQLDRQIRGGGWNYRGTGTIPRLSEMTLGCVGFGRIGQLTAERLAPWFARVLAHDPYAPAATWPADVERRELDDLLPDADVLSLHLPLTEETAGLLGAQRLARLPRGSLLVNTARGGLVDLDALQRLLDDGHVRGAGLDVLPQEPPPADHPIRTHPKVLLTPHGAWYSEPAERDLRRMAAEQIVAWARGERPPFLAAGPAPAGAR